MRPLELQGAVVAVTGAAGGIGRATVARLVAAGARVALGDLDGDAARRCAQEAGGGARGYDLDVADRASFAAFLEQAQADLGPLLVLVNNAGIMPLGAFAQEDPAVTRRTVDVNLWGVLHGTSLALPGMLERRDGHVINVASMMGRMHAPGAATYGAAKHAVVGFGAAVREELRDTGVGLTTVLPSAVNTPLISGLALKAFPPVVEPDEVAAAIVAACRHRRAEVTVPRWLGRAPELERLMPRALTAYVRRRLGGDAALHGVDAEARAAYEASVRPSGP